jgi:hypothetical protein
MLLAGEKLLVTAIGTDTCKVELPGGNPVYKGEVVLLPCDDDHNIPRYRFYGAIYYQHVIAVYAQAEQFFGVDDPKPNVRSTPVNEGV